jgi:hypothetical protein
MSGTRCDMDEICLLFACQWTYRLRSGSGLERKELTIGVLCLTGACSMLQDVLSEGCCRMCLTWGYESHSKYI